MSSTIEAKTRGRSGRRRLAAGAGAVAVHAVAFLAVLHEWGREPPELETPPITVMLAPPPPPPPPVLLSVGEPSAGAPAEAPGPATSEPPKPSEPKPPPTPQRITKKPQPSEVAPRYVPPEPVPQITEVAVSAADLASATTAESEAAGGGGAGAGDGLGGGGDGAGRGGRCDMVARLQRALRNDPSVRRALAGARRAPGFERRPLVVWNGEWVRHGVEEGKGLASLRQAIAVEVGFSPKACRAQSVRGLVLLSLTDSPGSGRVVLGTGSWRWSDLLELR